MSRQRAHSLADFVSQRRQALGLSAYEASRRAGVDRSYWSYLEAGRFRAPRPNIMQGIADAIEIPVERLYKIVGVQRHHDPQQLPTLRPYLRAKYHLPHQAVVDLERYFDFLRSHYGIPNDKPVFPPKVPAKTTQTARQHPQAKRRAA